MIESPKALKKTTQYFYSDYGYIQVSQNDLKNEEIQIQCEGKNSKFTGNINVVS